MANRISSSLQMTEPAVAPVHLGPGEYKDPQKLEIQTPGLKHSPSFYPIHSRSDHGSLEPWREELITIVLLEGLDSDEQSSTGMNVGIEAECGRVKIEGVSFHQESALKRMRQEEAESEHPNPRTPIASPLTVPGAYRPPPPKIPRYWK